MPGERHDDIVSLHDHFSSLLVAMREVLIARIEALREYTDTRFKAQEDATERARASMEKRLDGMNEFRDTLKDQGATFITKTEHSAWCDRVSKLELSKATLEGKADQKSVTTALIIALIGIALAVISIIINLR